MTVRIVITPTYRNHFKFIKTYLKSFDEFLLDRNFPLYFIINADEKDELEHLISPYQNKLNLHIVTMEEILTSFQIPFTPQQLLKKYGRLSFQTLKKFYGALYLNPDEFLLLDSESIMQKPTSLNSLFTTYFQHPYLLTSECTTRPDSYQNTFTYNYIKTIANILHNSPQYWLVESYNWFYEMRILKDLIKEFGTPLEIVAKAGFHHKFSSLEGVLECLLYYQYIINNNQKYHYDIISLEKTLPLFLGAEYQKFLNRFNSSPLYICGMFEQFTPFINSRNCIGFCNFLNTYSFPILRFEIGRDNYQAQQELLQKCDIHILASNQYHNFDYPLISKRPQQIQNCIITPTYRAHFKYISKYLDSFVRYAEDTSDFFICFTISREEYVELKDIIQNYTDKLIIKVCFFEDILATFNITQTPAELLQKYGKFTYQTLKKFYTMLFLGAAHRFLVLDSESMVINKTSISRLFSEYFAAPFIAYSEMSKRQKTDNFLARVVADTDLILHCGTDKWMLENFIWFYDYKILQDMFERYGSPLAMAEKIHQSSDTLAGAFEIELYNQYIYQNAKHYGYRFININKALESYLSPIEKARYERRFYARCYGGCGLLEHALCFVTKENVTSLAALFKNYHFNIIRCEKTTDKTYLSQRKFLALVKPDILAASQNHLFGLNDTFSAVFLKSLNLSPLLKKFRKHGQKLISPLKYLVNRLSDIVALLFYSLQIVFHLLIYIPKSLLIYRQRQKMKEPLTDKAISAEYQG